MRQTVVNQPRHLSLKVTLNAHLAACWKNYNLSITVQPIGGHVRVLALGNLYHGVRPILFHRCFYVCFAMMA